MHYKTNQFSKDPNNLKTINILDPDVMEREVGQRKYLSIKDKQRIKILYNCREYIVHIVLSLTHLKYRWEHEVFKY